MAWFVEALVQSLQTRAYMRVIADQVNTSMKGSKFCLKGRRCVLSVIECYTLCVWHR